MANYESRNRDVINKAFQRLASEKETIVRDGMCRLAKAGLEYLVSAHDAHDPLMMHVTENNTMAYAVAHNGQIVTMGSHNGGDDDMPGSATETAASILSNTTGWVAIILSDMEGYYRVDYEQGFLFEASFNTASEFQSYFKRIN